MKSGQRILSFILVLGLCVSMLPVSTMALDLPELDILEDVVEAVEAEENTVEDETIEAGDETIIEADDESEEDLTGTEMPADTENSAEIEETPETEDLVGNNEELLVESEKSASSLFAGGDYGEAWLWPVEGAYIIESGYGYRPKFGRNHNGIDIVASSGTAGRPVRAAKSGTVVESCSKYGDSQFVKNSLGNYVIIKHSDGTYSVYAHLQKGGVMAKGTTVQQGDTVGYIGNSGNSYGYHLHFEIRSSSSTYMSPMPANAEIKIRNSYDSARPINYIFTPEKLAGCTYYPSNMTVTVKSEDTLKNAPKEAAEDLNVTAYRGDELKVTGLYENQYGNFWYRVVKNGITGYIWCCDVVTGNFNYEADISGVVTPSTIAVGDSFSIGGTVYSNYNGLANVYAYVYKGNATSGTSVISSSASAKNSRYYNLAGSSVDKNLKFGSLKAGDYTYVVAAKMVGYYSEDGKTKLTYSNSKPQLIWKKSFEVDDGTPYVTKCEYYPCYIHIEVTEKDEIETEPRDAGADLGVTGNVGDTYLATGVFVNTYGYSWYRIDVDGKTGYYWCPRANVVSTCDENICIEDDFIPEIVVAKEKLSIYGTIQTAYSGIEEVCTSIYTKSGELVESVTDKISPATSHSIEKGNAANLGFEKLKTGFYRLVITAKVSNYYSEDGTVLNKFTKEYEVVNKELEVIDAADFASKGTYYPCYMKAKVTVKDEIETQPRDGGADLGVTGNVGDVLLVTGLLVNPYGNCWYRVLVNGKTGYYWCPRAELYETCNDDVHISDKVLPTTMMAGDPLSIGGTVYTDYSGIKEITASIHTGAGNEIANSTDAIAEVTKRYTLNDSEAANQDFEKLQPGTYYLDIGAQVCGYYSVDGETLSFYEKDAVVLSDWEFVVGEAVVHGDVNGDGNINVQDLVRLMKYIVGLNVNVVKDECDTNRDGGIDILDVVRLVKSLRD